MLHVPPQLLSALDRLGAAVPADPDWAMWPMGPARALLPMLAKLVLVALILGGLALLLRRLFGPGGPWRESWMDRKTPEDETGQGNGAEEKDASEDGADSGSGSGDAPGAGGKP
ncbi:MAG: hypothetical protein H0S85_09805 [Desulfovibrionaceae bacterium]|jgi:hypothetical protein|nr:hypothetical protein [Desulfovibrionaceae bacterium]